MMLAATRLRGDRGRADRFEARRRLVDEMLYAEIAKRRQEPDLADRDDVFSALLLAEDEEGSRLTDQEVRDEHRDAEPGGEVPPCDVAKADAVHHDETDLRRAQRRRRARERGRIVLLVGRERHHRRVEAVGAPARRRLRHVPLGRRQHTEPPGM